VNKRDFRFSQWQVWRWLSSGLITLMMDAASTSETLVNFYQTTRCSNPEDSHLQMWTRVKLQLCIHWVLDFYVTVILCWVGCVACTGEVRNAYRILVKEPEGETQQHGKL
jgi:hypothetical protein